jgi:phage FluMu gp28-like protein
VKLHAAWYLAHMPKMKAGLQDGTLTDIPRDDALRDDLRAIELVKGVPMVPNVNTASAGAKQAASEAGEGKGGRRHGDFAVSLVMAEYAFHREAGEIDYTPAPASASTWADDDSDDGAGSAGGRKGGW